MQALQNIQTIRIIHSVLDSERNYQNVLEKCLGEAQIGFYILGDHGLVTGMVEFFLWSLKLFIFPKGILMVYRK